MGSVLLPGGRARRRRHEHSRGQTLVEFALLFPIFWTLLLGLIDFAFAFNGVLAVDHASRSAALVAAEAGNGAGGDCVILRDVEAQLTPPASSARIQRVEDLRDLGDRRGHRQPDRVPAHRVQDLLLQRRHDDHRAVHP